MSRAALHPPTIIQRIDVPFIDSLTEEQKPVALKWLASMYADPPEARIIAHNWITDPHLTPAAAQALVLALSACGDSPGKAAFDCLDALIPTWMTLATAAKAPPSGQLSCIRK